MPVVDKYRPIDPTPTTLSPPGQVFGSLVVTGLALALFSVDSLETWVTFKTDGDGPLAELVGSIAQVSDSLGVRELRHRLDDLTAPLDHTARLFRAEDAGGVAELAPEPEPEPEPSVPPGERWTPRALDARVDRILMVGASSIQYAIGTELQRVLETYDGLDVERKGKVSTGLTRDDVFDWPAEVRRLMDVHHPQVVVAQFGGNDAQPLISPTEGRQGLFEDGWIKDYTRRVTGLCDDITATGALPIFVGMPVMRSSSFSRRMATLNGITSDAMAACGGRYVPIADLSADSKGAYRADVRFGGRSGRMRMDDGIHFTRLGGMYIADHLSKRLEQEILLVPPAEATADAPPPALAHPLTIPSALRGPSSAMAYVPQEVPTEGLPMWVLLHGADGSWRDWPEHEHRELQRLSAELGMVIVAPDGEPYGWYLDSPQHLDHRIASWLVEDALPSLEAHLPVNGTIGISGNSMGGHGALTAALAHPARFAAVSSMSGVVDLPHAASRSQLQDLLGTYEEAPDAWETRSAHHLIAADPAAPYDLPLLLSCGDKDLWYGPNERFHQLLESRGTPHAWIPQKGGHAWSVWKEALPEHARWMATQLGAPRWTPPPPPLPEPATDPGL